MTPPRLDSASLAPVSLRSWAALGAVFAVAFVLRAYPLLRYEYPTGADYGHHLYYAEQYLSEGRLPVNLPRFQLGRTEWSVLPGGSLLYALVSGLSGTPALALARITAFFGLVEMGGVYLLIRRCFRRHDVALWAALVVALMPAGSDMMAWSAYPNVIAIALMPYAFCAWIDYWRQPTPRRLILAVLVICGTASIHHLSSMWLGLTLAGFSFAAVVRHPLATLSKLLPLVLGCLVVGFPIILRVLELALSTDAGRVILSQSDRFVNSRIDWSVWVQVLTPVSVMFLVGGLATLFLRDSVASEYKLLVGVYGAVGILFGFGWLLGLHFAYLRAAYFYTLPAAFGAAALFCVWRPVHFRPIMAGVLLLYLGLTQIAQLSSTAAYYRTLTPDVIGAAAWLKQNSQPGDVVITGTFLGFHMTWLLDRPTMVALSPDLVGNPQELQVASDASAVLLGLDNMDDILNLYSVRYVFLRAVEPDIPDPFRSRLVFDSDPRMRLVYANPEVLIFQVLPL